MRIWEKYLDERDAKIYAGAGLGQTYGLGAKPALIIIDVQYGFTGDGPERIEESIKKYPTSCGAASWEAVTNIQRVLDAAREINIPVCYTVVEELAPIKGELLMKPI